MITSIHVIVPLVPIMEGVVTGIYFDEIVGFFIVSYKKYDGFPKLFVRNR